MAISQSILDLIFRIRKQGKGGKEVEDELKKTEKQVKKTQMEDLAWLIAQTTECFAWMKPYTAALRGLTRMARRGQDRRYLN